MPLHRFRAAVRLGYPFTASLDVRAQFPFMKERSVQPRLMRSQCFPHRGMPCRIEAGRAADRRRPISMTSVKRHPQPPDVRKVVIEASLRGREQ